jgi:nicotinamidase-related amidase
VSAGASPGRGRLLETEDSVLCIIDVQPHFVGRLAETDGAARFLQRVVWVAALANALGIPIVVTEEEPDRNGSTLAEIVERLPERTARCPKPTFGLADVPEILAAVEATARHSAVLVGMETDVCVAHSALGLLDRGYRVVVVRDAVLSPGTAHEDGLERMRAAGATLLGTKGLFYEWARTVDMASKLDELMASVPVPDDLVL